MDDSVPFGGTEVSGTTLDHLAAELGESTAVLWGMAAAGRVEVCIPGRAIVQGRRERRVSLAEWGNCAPRWVFRGSRIGESGYSRPVEWREYGGYVARNAERYWRMNREYALRADPGGRGEPIESPANVFMRALAAGGWLLVPSLDAGAWSELRAGRAVVVHAFRLPWQASDSPLAPTGTVVAPDGSRFGWREWCDGMEGHSPTGVEVSPAELCVSPAGRERLAMGMQEATLRERAEDGIELTDFNVLRRPCVGLRLLVRTMMGRRGEWLRFRPDRADRDELRDYARFVQDAQEAMELGKIPEAKGGAASFSPVSKRARIWVTMERDRTGVRPSEDDPRVFWTDSAEEAYPATDPAAFVAWWFEQGFPVPEGFPADLRPGVSASRPCGPPAGARPAISRPENKAPDRFAAACRWAKHYKGISEPDAEAELERLGMEQEPDPKNPNERLLARTMRGCVYARLRYEHGSGGITRAEAHRLTIDAAKHVESQ
ncbi:MAG: hypothetical protein ACQEXJ_02750 [Myxococcota bacterium]